MSSHVYGAASRVGGKLPRLFCPLSLSGLFPLLGSSHELAQRKGKQYLWLGTRLKSKSIWCFQCQGSGLGRLLTLKAVWLVESLLSVFHLLFCLKRSFH